MMHLGFVSAIVPEFSFEELIRFTQAQGFTTVEAACWPESMSCVKSLWQLPCRSARKWFIQQRKLESF